MNTYRFPSRYQLLELRHFSGVLPVIGLFTGLALVGLTQWIIPALPPVANALLERAFLIQGLGAVTLLNDFLAVYMVLFFVGVAQLTRVVVIPREQRQLDVLLSKPLRRAEFLAARTGPVLLSTLALGAVMAAACAWAASAYQRPGESVTASGAWGAALIITAITLTELALLNVVFLLVRDAFQALLVAFVVWMIPLAPTSAFIYRPDLFVGRELLAEYTVLPANLLWLQGQALGVGLALLAAALVLAVASLRVAGAVFERVEQ